MSDPLEQEGTLEMEPLDPMDRAAAEVMGNQRSRMKQSLYGSLQENPDMAAKAVKLGRQNGLPTDVIKRNLPQVQRDVAMTEMDRTLQRNPRLLQFLTNRDNASISHDDTDNLSRTEAGISALVGPSPSVGSVLTGLAKTLPQGLEATRQGIRLQWADLIGSKEMQADAMKRYGANAFDIERNTPEFESATARGVYSGGTSFVRQLPALAAAVALRNPGIALGSIGLETEADAYGKYRSRGASPADALYGAVHEGAIEVATEALPMSFMVKQLGRVGFGKFITSLLAREIPSEQLATIGQDAFDTAIANPDKTWGQYLEERPGAAYQTLVATITQGGAMGAINTVANRMSGAAQKAADAENNSRLFAVLDGLAKASKVRERDPATFQDFVKTAAADGPVEDIYVNAAVFAQSLQDAGVDINAVAAAAPAIKEQLDIALTTGGDLKIPIDQYTTAIAGSDFSQSLIPHLKTDANGMSQIEAAEFMQSQGPALEAEIARVLGEKQNDDAFKASRDAVVQDLRGKLNEAGRFTDDVNLAKATLVGNFYAVMGAKLGMTAEEFGAKYGLEVQATQGTTGRQMDQAEYPLQDPPQYEYSNYKDLGGRSINKKHNQYLAATKPLTVDEASQDNIADLAGMMRAGRTIDPPRLTLEDGKVTAHDGRHRAHAAKELGITRLPVLMMGAQPEGDLTGITGQTGNPITFEQSATLRSGRETLKKYGLDPERKYTTREVAAALEARQRNKYGLIAPDDRSDESAKTIGKWMTAEVLFEMQHPEKSGIGWYSEKFQRALDVMAQRFPELATDKTARDIFTALIAITSDGQKVAQNFIMARDIYADFRTTGRFATDKASARQKSVDINLGILQKLHDELGPQGMHEYLMEEHTVSRLKVMAKEAGTEFATKYQAHIELPRAAVLLGPKLGAFYANLMGSSGYLTMDRWWNRSFNRYRGTLLMAPTREGLDRFKQLMGDPSMSDDAVLSAVVAPRNSYAAKDFKNGTEIEKAANTIYKAAFENLQDVPFNSTDRTFMLKAVAMAQKELSKKGVVMSISDIQAVLWYYEKRLYGELGARQTADVSYEDAARRAITEGTGGDRPGGRPVSDPGGDEGLDDAGGVGDEDYGELASREFYQSGTPSTSDSGRERGGREDRQRQGAEQGLQRPLGQHESLAGLPSTSPGANPAILDIAAAYMRAAGLPTLRQTDYVNVDTARASRIAEAYSLMEHLPNDPEVAAAYAQMIKETLAQFQVIKQLGIKFTFIKQGQTYPYPKGPIEALYDIRDNKHLWVFPTTDGFGTENEIDVNPLLAMTDEYIDGKQLQANDVFRIVHDIFGHAKEGNGFGPVGEENAWQSHAIMYSPLALKAMTSETRGQNSWVNYGPHGEHNRANPKATIYADQKVGILPDWVMEDGRVPTMAVADDTLMQSVFHGTPHIWAPEPGFPHGRPRLDKMGTGEGAQAFGWGWYSAENKGVAAGYHKALAPVTRAHIAFAGQKITPKMLSDLQNSADPDIADFFKYEYSPKFYTPKKVIAWLDEKIANARAEHIRYEGRVESQRANPPIASTYSTEQLQEFADAQGKKAARLQKIKDLHQSVPDQRGGALYSLDIPDSILPRLLDWDKPLTAQTPEAQAILKQVADSLAVGGESFWDRDLQALAVVAGEIKKPMTGADVYADVMEALGSHDSKTASEYLSKFGIVGNRYLDGSSRADGKGAYNFVIWDQPTLDKIALLERNGEKLDAIRKADSSLEQPARGSIRFADDITSAPSIISLLNNADLSTFLHESGHFFLQVMADVATRPGAPAEVVADMNALLSWFGVPDLPAWNSMTIDEQRPHHEAFARGFETYLMEGKPPTPELAPLFQKFRAWLLNVYKSILSLTSGNAGAAMQVNLSDEVRRVMDRMIATSETIKEAEDSQGYAPLFETRPDGMSEAEWDMYQWLGQSATQDAIHELESRSMRDLRWASNARNAAIKRLQREAEDQRAIVRAEVSAEVNAEPINQVRVFLRDGERFGEPVPGPHKLSVEGLEEMYGSPEDRYALLDWKALSTSGMTGREGMHPDEMAADFGFRSGDELVQALLQPDDTQARIDAITDQRMLERYGDLNSPANIARAADEAIHNDARIRFVATELHALNKAAGRKPLLTAAAKAFAELAITRKLVRDLKPAEYAAAARRAGQAAVIAMKAGDLQTAAVEKRNQLVNEYAAQAAHKALREVDKKVAYMKKVGSVRAQEKMRGESAAQLLAVLDRFDLRKAQSLKEIDRRQALAEWAANEANRLSAPPPMLSQKVLDEANRTHYKNLSLEEFRGLVDSIKQLEHLARREYKAFIELRNLTIQAEVAKGVAEIQAAFPEAFDTDGAPRLDTPLTNKYVPSLGKKLKEGTRNLIAEFIPMEDLVDRLTAGKFGQLHDSIFGRLSQASDRKSMMAGAVRDKLKPFLDAYTFKEKRDFARKEIPGTNMTRENIVMLALHWGNEQGRQRLQSQGFTEAAMATRLKHLTGKDVDLINAIWDLNDNYIWPMYTDLNMRTQGKAPAKVQPVPFTFTNTGGGQVTLQGGYIKLVYDSDFDESTRQRDSMSDAINMISGRTGVNPKTDQGSSKERIQELSKMPLLEMRAVAQAVNEHMHDIHFREAVADTVRILREPLMRDAIKAVAGKEVYTELLAKVNEIAARPVEPTGAVLKGLNIARKNTVVVLMSGVKTALVNYTGLLPALTRVNAGLLVKNLAKVHSHRYREMIDFAKAKSDYMTERNQAFTSDLQNQFNAMSVKNQILPQMGTFLILMRMVDQMTSTTVWLSAYEAGMGRFKLDDGSPDEDRAIEYANNVTRGTQGSGREVDTSKIMTRFGPWAKLFTMFYSFFNKQAALLARQGLIAEREWAKGNRVKAVGLFTASYVAIVALPAMINDLAVGRCDDAIDGKEDWTRCVAKSQVMFMAGYIPVVRDLAPYMWSLIDDKDPTYGLRMTSISAYFEGITKGLASTVDVATGDNDAKDTKSIFMGLAFSFGLPGLLMWNVAAGANAVAEGKAGPQAVLFGPPKK